MSEKMQRLLLCLCFSSLTISLLPAQIFEPVFPNLSGDELRDSVAAHYRPTIVLDYANARDTLYARVLAAEDDTLRCIYSGYALYLDPTQDPTQYVYLNGSSLGINTEHAYPQGKGASDGNARSDMHHLFPARIPVNEARGEAPYTEIPDAQTQRWFRGAQILFSIPAQDKDAYSEAIPGVSFEPRESVKGDLARAIFYFYTMYRAQANAADPNFFESQRLTLCQWQNQDPPDSVELIKTWRIALYQEGKPNPFILDCTLAHRCWCPETPSTCAITSIHDIENESLDLQLRPNPFDGNGELTMILPFKGNIEIKLRSITGQELANWQVAEAGEGIFSYSFSIPEQYAGQMNLLEVRLWNGTKTAQGRVKVVGW